MKKNTEKNKGCNVAEQEEDANAQTAEEVCGYEARRNKAASRGASDEIVVERWRPRAPRNSNLRKRLKAEVLEQAAAPGCGFR